MILKQNFHPLKVIRYVKLELLFALLTASLVYTLYQTQLLRIHLPFAVAAILGSALAIFIAFRNNTSYNRWWEARTLWGNIINASRVFARLVITFTDSHAHQENYNRDRSEAFKRNLLNKTIAFSHALRLHLRKEDRWEILQPFLTEAEWQSLHNAQNKPNLLQLMMGKELYTAMANGTLGGFDSFQLEGQLLALANSQGGCERIKNTPLLRQYDFFTRVFLYTFIFLLPFSLIADFAKFNTAFLMIPTTIIIAFVFAIIGKVGAVNEDPFENNITDVPMTALCNVIEIDIKEMMGEKNLPQKITVENGYLF